LLNQKGYIKLGTTSKKCTQNIIKMEKFQNVILININININFSLGEKHFM